MERLTIIGLGLIGGSLGLALRAAKLADVEIVGYDKDTVTSVEARRFRVVDKSEPILERAVKDAGLVIIATPIMAVREVMEQIAGHLRENFVVTDTASTKCLVMEWAKELLPPTVSFVGGHPMAGKEMSGVVNAEAGLFAEAEKVGATFAPLSRTARQCIGYREIWEGRARGESEAQTVERIQLHTRHFARKQGTWFRRFPEIEWLEAPAREPAELGREIARRISEEEAGSSSACGHEQ